MSENMYKNEIDSHELDAARLKRNATLVSALGLIPKKDGNMWCFAYGENPQEGISGFGKTIYEAASEFESNYCNEQIKIINK